MVDAKAVNLHGSLLYRLIIIALFAFSSKVLACEESAYDELTVTLEQIRVQNDIPAMAVAIISSGEVTYIKGFGFLDEHKVKPTTPDSLFRIASISKLFTAQAIMQLVEQEKLGLDDNVGQYLSTFKNTNITVRELLTHSSGLSDTVKPVNFDDQRPERSYLDLVRKSAVNDFKNKEFEYSDTGFNILGSVISTISGLRYEKYITENILAPAGMQRSKYFDGLNGHFAEALPSNKGKLIDKSEQRPYDLSFNPSEGLVANVSDLSRWLKLTLANDVSILKTHMYKQMLEPQIKSVWGEIYMGLGWQVYKSEGANIARHPGSMRGYKSLVLTYPENKDALILLTNSSNTPRWEIAKSITRIFKQHSEW